MRIIKVGLKRKSYNVIVGYNIISLLGEYLHKLRLGRDAYIITNARIKNKYGAILANALKASGFSLRFKTVPDSEESKSIATATSVIKDLAYYDNKRQVFIAAFGGGVIGDLSGFIASVYKRGIPYIQIPTTLLAQADSSIGGKTALDLPEGKNLIGAFYQPRLVFSDIKFLGSLSPRQIRSGLSEIIKYAIIKDRQLFVYLEKRCRDILTLKPSALEYVVQRSSRIKAGIVGSDEREENGLRTILNFGHTLGHAIEAAADFKGYNHGEAVSLGILIAADISKSLNLIDQSLLTRIESLMRAAGLPQKIEGISLEKIINAHYRDKKFIGRKNRLVLTCGIGKTKIAENIPLEVILAAIKKRTRPISGG